jgi:hypothetical protein
MLRPCAGLAHRFGPIAAVAQMGISTDIFGAQRHVLPMGYADRLHAAWPRHNLAYALVDAIAWQADQNRAKATPLSFAAHVGELLFPTQVSVTWFDLVEAAGWDNQLVAGREAAS